MYQLYEAATMTDATNDLALAHEWSARISHMGFRVDILRFGSLIAAYANGKAVAIPPRGSLAA